MRCPFILSLVLVISSVAGAEEPDAIVEAPVETPAPVERGTPAESAPTESAPSTAKAEEAPLSLRRDVLPWVTTFAGGVSAILGAGLVAVGFFPFLQVMRLQGELAAAEGRAPLEGDDVILLPMLQASVYDRRLAFQTWGSPLAAGGAALLIGGALMVAGGVFVGVSRKLEVLE